MANTVQWEMPLNMGSWYDKLSQFQEDDVQWVIKPCVCFIISVQVVFIFNGANPNPEILVNRICIQIFGMSMWNYGTGVMDALMELIISLATSSGQYLDQCLRMLVANFMPPRSFLSLLNQQRGIKRKGQVIDRVHKTLQHISKLVPLSPLKLEDTVVWSMPNIEPLIVIYVENMLKLESGALSDLVGRTMLLAIMDRLIDLDVMIAWDDILQEDFTKGIFDMELEFLEGPVDDCQQDGDEFVMFYACSLDPENCGRRFADTLFDIFKSSICPEERMSAVAYLASFLARAKFLPISSIAEHVERVAASIQKLTGNSILGARPLLEEFLRLSNVPENFVSSGLLESELSMAFGGVERLDMFFPFDPFLLMRSDSYIRPHFVYWSMVRSSYDDVDDDEGTSDEDDIEICTAGKGINIADNGSARSYDQGLDEFDNEMSKMSNTKSCSMVWRGITIRHADAFKNQTLSSVLVEINLVC